MLVGRKVLVEIGGKGQRIENLLKKLIISVRTIIIRGSNCSPILTIKQKFY